MSVGQPGFAGGINGDITAFEIKIAFFDGFNFRPGENNTSLYFFQEVKICYNLFKVKSMAENQNIKISISTGTIFKIVAVAVALMFVWLIRDILLVVFVAIILASLLEPVVDKIAARKI